MKIIEINNKKIWEDFNQNTKNIAYFQSWDFGEVMKKSGVNIIRLGFYENNVLIGIAQVFEIKAKRGYFFHVRQGPVLKNWDKLGQVLELLIEFSKKKRVWYLRISPLICEDDKQLKILKKNGFRISSIHNADAENRWILKINNDLEEILKNMRKTTRYMIKKGDLSNIKIIRSQKIDDLSKFAKIYEETSFLKRFIPLNLLFFEFDELKKNNDVNIYLASKGNDILAGAVIIYYAKTAIYRYGATSLKGRNTSASYLLQWQAIKDAKERGLSTYDFWGIAKNDDLKDSWYGISQFKKGFGGERLDFVHSVDKPISKWYFISYLIDYYTRIRKGHF